MRHRIWTLLAMCGVIAGAGCGGDSSESEGDVRMTISMSDSVVALQRDTAADGSVTAGCNTSFVVAAEGTRDAFAVLRGGRVQYYWWQTGAEALSYDWTPDAIGRFFLDSIVAVGTTRGSMPHGFGQSEPAQPVRGTVTFDYGMHGSDRTHTTEPYRFYCY